MDFMYVLIQDEEGIKNWYMIIKEFEEDIITKATELWRDSAIRQMLDGRKGLTLDFINKMTLEGIENKQKWLNEGEILLINRNGGFMFLTNSHIILKEIYTNTFPIIDDDYINGLLSPNGEFIPCEYGHHHEITQNITDNDNLYISISHDFIGNNSAIFIGDSITDEQKSYLLSNLDKLDSVCITQLKQRGIIK